MQAPGAAAARGCARSVVGKPPAAVSQHGMIAGTTRPTVRPLDLAPARVNGDAWAPDDKNLSEGSSRPRADLAEGGCRTEAFGAESGTRPRRMTGRVGHGRQPWSMGLWATAVASSSRCELLNNRSRGRRFGTSRGKARRIFIGPHMCYRRPKGSSTQAHIWIRLHRRFSQL